MAPRDGVVVVEASPKDGTWQNLLWLCNILMGAKLYHMALPCSGESCMSPTGCGDQFDAWFSPFGQGLGYALKARRWGLENYRLQVCQLLQEVARHPGRWRWVGSWVQHVQHAGDIALQHPNPSSMAKVMHVASVWGWCPHPTRLVWKLGYGLS